jgi:hypothetical protein
MEQLRRREMKWTKKRRRELTDNLRALAEAGGKSRSRDAQYLRLELVLASHRELKADGVVRKVTGRIARDAGIEGWKEMNPINRLIAVGATETKKIQSRLAASVKIAVHRGWPEIGPRLKKYGGIAGLASLWAEDRRSPPGACAADTQGEPKLETKSNSDAKQKQKSKQSDWV